MIGFITHEENIRMYHQESGSTYMDLAVCNALLEYLLEATLRLKDSALASGYRRCHFQILFVCSRFVAQYEYYALEYFINDSSPTLMVFLNCGAALYIHFALFSILFFICTEFHWPGQI